MKMSTPLPTSRLGSGGPEITRVGFGAWAVGGGGWSFSWGPQDDEASVRAIHHAVGNGVNWVDTAAVYGYGHSEEVVGRAVAEIPRSERPLIFTKCGLRWHDHDRMRQPDRVLEPKAIRGECEASLRRLGVERIDLYQFHQPDPATAVEDSWGEMQRLVAEGKVRWAGVSNFGVDLLEACERGGHVESLQPPFSMIRRGAAEDVLPWCAAHGTSVIVYSPMQSGLLTDSFSVDRVSRMAEDDWRPRHSDEFRAPKLERNLTLRDALLPIAAKHRTTAAAVSVAWTLAWPGVTGAIVGARSPEQVDGWLGAATLVLDGHDLESIAAAIERTGAGSGPTAPSGF